MNLFQQSVPKSVLGMAFDSNVLTFSVLTANGDGICLQKNGHAEMALDLLSGETELVAREIRNHLQAAGIHETRCVFCVPLQWVISHPLKMPNLSKEDEHSYIALHAEREFPYPAQDLSIAVSRYTSPQEQVYTLVSALPIRQVEKIKEVLQQANLNLCSLTLGTAVFDTAGDEVQLILQKREQGIDCFVVSASSIILARHFKQQSAEYADDPGMHLEDIRRDLRITLGQIPSDIRHALTGVAVYGNDQWCGSLRGIIQSLPQCRNANIVTGKIPLHVKDSNSPGMEALYSASASAAYAYLTNKQSALEFLPPYISPIQRLFERMSSKRNVVIGEVAAVVIVLFFMVFGYQHWNYSNLSSQWAKIEEQVTEVEAIQNNVKQFRPWFNRKIPSLSVLKILTERFPDDGSIWVKTVQIENESFITFSGFANQNEMLLETIDSLNEVEAIEALQVRQMTGKEPLQYSLQFLWVEG